MIMPLGMILGWIPRCDDAIGVPAVLRFLHASVPFPPPWSVEEWDAGFVVPKQR